MTVTPATQKVITALDNATATAVYMPVQRTIGAGYAIQADMVVALVPDRWEKLIRAISELEEERD